MGFELLVVGTLVLLVLGLLALGAWHPRTGAQVLRWQPARSYEDEVRLELEDVDQMLEAQNERRRRSGRPELTEEKVRAEVREEERQRERRARGAG